MVRLYKPMGRLVLANAQEGPMIRSMSIWYVCETYPVRRILRLFKGGGGIP
jgi:hypothetical protein